MKNLTLKIRDLKPDETAITKAVEVPSHVLAETCTAAARYLKVHDEDVILLTISCKIDALVVSKEAS